MPSCSPSFRVLLQPKPNDDRSGNRANTIKQGFAVLLNAWTLESDGEYINNRLKVNDVHYTAHSIKKLKKLEHITLVLKYSIH